ncbi:hypothetical protein [Hyphomonas sp.]|uniref:hypothetical protein n=1 Tax=Hyphomonas sp. TaxID=87 RepID=UPI00356AC451
MNVLKRRAKLFLRQLVRKIDHQDVGDHVREEGQMSGRYVFMAVTSCAIATLGLLLSSPAVIIGAMLISPLMGPIMLTVNLGQVLIDEDKALEAEAYLRMADSSIAAPLRAEISRIESLGMLRQSETELRAAIPFKLAAADIDAEHRTATLIAAPHDGLSISACRTMEEGLKTNFPTRTIHIVPPVPELLLIAFDNGKNTLSPAGESVLGDSISALERWSSKSVEVVGYASTAGALQRFDNRNLAYQRAVAEDRVWLDGDQAISSHMQQWLGLSHFADEPRRVD